MASALRVGASDSSDISRSTILSSDSDCGNICSKSDADSEAPGVCGLRTVKPYQFEPAARKVGAHNDTDSDAENADENDDVPQCQCGNCQPMDNDQTSLCCCEVPKVWKLVDDFVTETRQSIDCIVNHPWFEASCLNPWTLKAAYMAYRQQYGHANGPSNERYRYTAYRQLARLAWGWLGKHVRVVLPACAVCKIREVYPSQSGQYKNFALPDI
uniref:P2X purinoreceptor 7 intracellular domain-containing protein n=1 Tax=Oryzias melastigma TaxID=30732 RepID=A0A3B3CPU1_ORYME